ncbi:hypothetical protein NE237_000473 [Protea cynaroides]|uniref:Serine-threonine/tyrosine-protein kinase catalytic domain-containing protein n=1 Tax=Protea cynaroides TaxID=273540 RepID=A0A9Q0KR98_9MAGN|nr:hypothetical protein NE237_000473 [Protea cynaroides]
MNYIFPSIRKVLSSVCISWDDTVILGGKKTNAWVSYNSITKFLSIFLSYSENLVSWGSPTMSYTVNLRDKLPEWIYVGFSTATESIIQSYSVLNGKRIWNCLQRFLSNLNIDVAIKRISIISKQWIKEFVSEVTIISRLKHMNLVQILDWCHQRGELFIVYDFMPKGSLDLNLYKGEYSLV